MYRFQSLSDPLPWHVVCDFDGTISPLDVTDALLAEFASPAWEAVEADWVAGRISARQCMAAQIALLSVSSRALDAFLDRVPLTEGFVDFVGGCRQRGIPLTVVSDGVDYAIRRVLDRHGVGDVPLIANALRSTGDAQYALDFPHSVEGCSLGVCKCDVVKRDFATGCNVLLVGDGLSDCCVAGMATAVVAREGKTLHRRCMEKGFPHATFTTFHEVLERVDELVCQRGIFFASVIVPLPTLPNPHNLQCQTMTI